MAYTLSKTNGGTLVLLNDGVVDTSVSSISLIGKNVSNFGDAQNENFLHMLENFAYNIEPRSPITGQLWFNTAETVNRPVAFDGLNWRPLAVLQYGTSLTNTLVNAGGSPLAASRPGDMWFDSVNKQLHVISEVTATTQTTLIGPESVTGFGTTRMASAKMLDTSNVGHAVIQTIVNGEVLSIQSPDAFTQTTVNPVPGFPTVYRGITFKNFSTSTKFTTSTSDVALYGILNHLDLSFTRNTNAEHLLANWAVDDGYALQFGTTAQSSVAWSSSNLVLNSTGGVKLQSPTTALTFNGASLVASASSVNLGSSSVLFATAYVGNISGGTVNAVGNIEGDWRLTTGSKFSPTFDTLNDLGTTSHRFNTVFAKNLNAGASSTEGNFTGIWNLTTGSNIQPVVDLGNNLGTASKRFGTIYTAGLSTLNNTATIAVTGSLRVDGDIVPSTDNLHSLGTPSSQWESVHATSVEALTVNSTILGTDHATIDTLDLSTGTFATLVDSLSNRISRFDTDGTLGANSNSYLSTQRAVKTYVDFVASQLRTALANIRTTPAGVVEYTAGTSAPTGYVVADGSSYPTNGATAELFAVIGYTYGGSGGTFRVPDLRGQFVRGVDLGRGIDSGRALGSSQESALGSHTHNYLDAYGAVDDAYDQGSYYDIDGNYLKGFQWWWPGTWGMPSQDEPNGAGHIPLTSHRTSEASGGAETRPTNVALLPIIKL